MRTGVFRHRVYRLSVVFWIGGAILILASWLPFVPSLIRWLGFVMTIIGFVLSVLLQHTSLFASQPLAPEAFQHPWASMFPDAAMIPDSMELVEQNSGTNAQIAQMRRDPAQALRMFEERGRIDGIYRHYLSKKGCHPQLALADIRLQIVQFQEARGAVETLHTPEAEFLARYTHYAPSTFIQPIGDDAQGVRYLLPNDCTPPDILVGYELTFRRNIFLGIVRVAAVQGTWAETDIQELVWKLAAHIDARIVTHVETKESFKSA